MPQSVALYVTHIIDMPVNFPRGGFVMKVCLLTTIVLMSLLGASAEAPSAVYHVAANGTDAASVKP